MTARHIRQSGRISLLSGVVWAPQRAQRTTYVPNGFFLFRRSISIPLNLACSKINREYFSLVLDRFYVKPISVNVRRNGKRRATKFDDGSTV